MSKMRGTTILWGQFIAALIGAFLSIQGATQWVAFRLGYQEGLGEPVFELLGFPVYWTWKYWEWMYYYDFYAKSIFYEGSWFIYGGVIGIFLMVVFLSIRRARRNKNADTYGSARWADRKDMEKAGCINDRGIVFGETNDKQKSLLRHNGSEHCFVFAPTRSGKGVGIVIPTLLSWRGSVIVYDVKRENWDITAGFRKKFSNVLRFDPTSPSSVKFNPLLEIRKGINEVRDVQNIADILVDPDGSKDRMDHWEKTGHSLLVGVILHVLYAEEDKSLTGVANFISNPKWPFEKTLRYMLRCQHLGNKTHPVVAGAARELLNKSVNELSGVVSTAMSFLGLYRDPIIAQNTASSDFVIDDLVNYENPVSLYMVIPPSDAERTRPLVRLMLNQIGRRLTENLGSDGSKSKHQLLMLLDEFPTLGRLSFFETELAYMAGYGIRALMIAQSLNQIEAAYGANNSILDNSHIRITYGTLDERTAKRVSDMLGTATENKQQTNYAGHRLAPWLGHVMVSEQENPRALLTPGEVLQFPDDESLVLVGGVPPYRASKLYYYKDSRFIDKVNLPCPNSSEEQAEECTDLGTANHWNKLVAVNVLPDKAQANNTASQVATEDALMDGVALDNDPKYEKVLAQQQRLDLSEDDLPDEDQERLVSDDQSIEEKHEIDTAIREVADKESDQEIAQEQHQRGQRNRMMDRQRSIELSRDDSGGGLPL